MAARKTNWSKVIREMLAQRIEEAEPVHRGSSFLCGQVGGDDAGVDDRLIMIRCVLRPGGIGALLGVTNRGLLYLRLHPVMGRPGLRETLLLEPRRMRREVRSEPANL